MRPCPTCEKPRSLCFPATSRVLLESGASISMRQLRIGDKLRTLGANGETTASEVIAFLHKETHTQAEFYKLETSGGNAITLSPQHLIFRKENFSSPISVIFASEINLGNLLYVSSGSDFQYQEVTRITMVTEIGVYAPLTTQGTMLVDGVLVSCYATWPSHDAAHLAMAPLRAAYAITRAWEQLTSLEGWLFWDGSSETDGFSWYALALITLTNVFT